MVAIVFVVVCVVVVAAAVVVAADTEVLLQVVRYMFSLQLFKHIGNYIQIVLMRQLIYVKRK